MAYKFQLGASIMSGALTQEGALAVNDEAGVTQGQISQAGAIIGSSLSASGDLNIVGTSNFGPENLVSINNSGVISASAQCTIHDAVLNGITVASADINGGAIDNTTIGASTQAAGQFTTLSGSGDMNIVGKINIGPGNQGEITAAGVFSGTGLSSSATLNVAGETKLGAGNQLTVSPAGILSSSATATLFNATLDRITVASADINGGTIDGAAINNTAIGGTTQAAGEFTTLSASSTLNVAGASNFGAGNQLSISAAGVLSSSATPTFNTINADRVVVNGQLIVAGDTTIVSSSTLLVTQSVTFEGLTDDFETVLGVTNPTADRSLLLPDIGGNIAAFSDSSFASAATAISLTELNILDGANITTAELNILDSDTAASSVTVVDADQIIINDGGNGGTMKQIAVSALRTYNSRLGVYKLSGSGDHAGVIRPASGSGFYYHAASEEDVGQLEHHGKYFLSGSGWSKGDKITLKAPTFGANGKISVFAQSSSFGDFIHSIEGQQADSSGSLLSELGLAADDSPLLVLESSNAAISLVCFAALSPGGDEPDEFHWSIM